jgi:serine/threonine protein kinase
MSQWYCRECNHSYSKGTGGDKCPVDGAILVPAETLRNYTSAHWLGRTISDRYLVFDVLGVGGFGAVYRALDTAQLMNVAIKIILPSADVVGADVKGRFRQEAQLLEELDSKRIIEVYEIGEFEGTLYMVLELFPGRPLDSLLTESGPLKIARAIHITSQVLDGLAIAHVRGLIHRDLKPGNILVDEFKDDEVKLIDFGIAKVIGARAEDSPKTGTGLVLGTVRYMAPEQLKRDGLVSPQTDLYSVGILFYEMLVGQTPYDGSPAEMAAAQLYSAAPLLPRNVATPELDQWFARVMAKSPSERFVDALTMQADLVHSVFDETTTEKRADYLSFTKRRSAVGQLPQLPDEVAPLATPGIFQGDGLDSDGEFPPETHRLNAGHIASILSPLIPAVDQKGAVQTPSHTDGDEDDGFTEEMNIADISLAQLPYYRPVDVLGESGGNVFESDDLVMPETEVLPRVVAKLDDEQEISDSDIIFDDTPHVDLDDEMTTRMNSEIVGSLLQELRPSVAIEEPLTSGNPPPLGGLPSTDGPQRAPIKPIETDVKMGSKGRLSRYVKMGLALALGSIAVFMIYQGGWGKVTNGSEVAVEATSKLDKKAIIEDITRSVSLCDCSRARRLFRVLIAEQMDISDGKISQVVKGCQMPSFGRCEGAAAP